MPIPTSGVRPWCVLMRTAVGVLEFCSRLSGSSTGLLAGECSVAVLCLGFQAGRLGASSASELELGGEQFAPRECSVGVLCKAREPTLCSMADSRPNLMQSTYDEPKPATTTMATGLYVHMYDISPS